MPDPWPFALLALAAFRVWKLIAEDTILDRPLKRVREYEAVTCPWCSGAYVSLGIYLLWIWHPQQTLYTASVLALSASVGILQTILNALSE